jgi:hypothetical protein
MELVVQQHATAKLVAGYVRLLAVGSGNRGDQATDQNVTGQTQRCKHHAECTTLLCCAGFDAVLG